MLAQRREDESRFGFACLHRRNKIAETAKINHIDVGFLNAVLAEPNADHEVAQRIRVGGADGLPRKVLDAFYARLHPDFQNRVRHRLAEKSEIRNAFGDGVNDGAAGPGRDIDARGSERCYHLGATVDLVESRIDAVLLENA